MRKIIKKNKILLVLLLSILMIGNFSVAVNAEPSSNISIPDINISIGNGNNSANSDNKTEKSPKDYVSDIKLLILLTVLSLLPSILIMLTSFTRIVVVFSFLKNAIGASQSIPNQILIGLALFLPFFIMAPVATQVNNDAIEPYLNGKIPQSEAISIGKKPIRKFMLKQTREKDLEIFVEADNSINKDKLTKENVPLRALIPAFAISELKTAFEIGFLLYLPFILIDLVVGSVLMSMGMMMIPPAMVSLPFKLLLFVMVDGWNLLVNSLIKSFG